MPSFKKYFAGLSANTYLLALASLFADVSTEMLYPVLPVFLTQTLGASAKVVGLVEGVAQCIQNVTQGFSGWLSDKLKRRKSIAIIGYALAAISKPLIGLSSDWAGVLGARSLDRLGTGIRSAPRDALVAASADAQHRGKAFGLEGIGEFRRVCRPVDRRGAAHLGSRATSHDLLPRDHPGAAGDAHDPVRARADDR